MTGVDAAAIRARLDHAVSWSIVPEVQADIRALLDALAVAERQRDDALAKIARALSDHWQTRGMWGGVLRDMCGRCRYGDGVPYLWPCSTRQVLTGEAAPDPRPPTSTPTAETVPPRVAGTGGPQNPAQSVDGVDCWPGFDR